MFGRRSMASPRVSWRVASGNLSLALRSFSWLFQEAIDEDAPRIPSTVGRAIYAGVFGPTVGDIVRLADTDLYVSSPLASPEGGRPGRCSLHRAMVWSGSIREGGRGGGGGTPWSSLWRAFGVGGLR